jgi:hypothetical protein
MRANSRVATDGASRIAAHINPFPVTDFAYHRSAVGDHARAALCLRGTPWQIERVAQKIRRVVGVLVVHSDPTGHDS